MTYQNSPTQSQNFENTANRPKALPPAASNPPPPQKPTKKSAKFGLKTKTVLAAIALGVIPVAVLGAISYKVTESHVTRQINQTQLARTRHQSKMLEEYIQDRANEAETLASNPIFTNPNLMDVVTISQKKAALDTFQDQTQYYDSIAYINLQGKPLFQSQSEHPLQNNYSQRPYFQKAIASKQVTMNEVGISNMTGEPRIEFAVPVKDAWTDQLLGVMRFRIPGSEITPVFSDYATKDEEWQMINTEGIFFASAVENLLNRPLTKYYPQLQKAHQNKQIVTVVADSPNDPDEKQLVNYVPVKVGALNPELNLGTAIALDTDIAFAPLTPLRWIFLGGTIGTALIVGSIAGFLANRIIQPLLKLTTAVNKLSQGKLDTRIKVQGQDELAALGNQINDMAEQLDNSMQRQTMIAKTSEMMARMSQARSTRELQMPFSLFLAEIRRLIKADRLVFYQFDQQWGGTVIAESVAEGFPRTLGVQFDDPCFAEQYVRKYQCGRIYTVTNIHQANLTECHLQQLEPYGVKASLVLPVIVEGATSRDSERLIGLLIAHQCTKTRVWTQSDIDYLQQIAYQLAMVLRGYVYYKEENTQKANTQKDLNQVVNSLQAMTNGNLSLDLASQLGRTNNLELTQSFDAILSNLRQMIAQIKMPTKQINCQLGVNKNDLTELKEQLRQQANQLVLIFAFIEQIANSIQEAAMKVGSTSQNINSVVTAIESEQSNYNQAIAFMTHLENTLRDNTDKVKNLSRASHKMAKVITSIRQINLRTSLLTNKLSKRIYDMEDSLADSALGLKSEIESIQQSIAATQELENVASGIEHEITEVLRDYEVSETRLEEDNYLIANTGDNLEQIVKTTKNAQQNVLSLVNIVNLQIQTSQKINSLKDRLDETSSSIYTLSDRAINSLENTAITAKDLENVVDFFKLAQSRKK
ncbi:MAG: GAF domain-containing protein [Waterburya sp.]